MRGNITLFVTLRNLAQLTPRRVVIPVVRDNEGMSRDRCTNRRHSLGTPPPARRDRRAPRNGCMRCVEAPMGTCPYREVWECSDEILEAGLQLGHCVIEEITRAAQREKALAMMEHVSTHMRDYARELIELWLDAWLYLQRANAWEWILWNRPRAEGGYDMAEEEHLRALARYRMAGSNRMFRRYLQLVPVIEDARENRRTGRFERLRRIVEQAKREAAERSKSA